MSRLSVERDSGAHGGGPGAGVDLGELRTVLHQATQQCNQINDLGNLLQAHKWDIYCDQTVTFGTDKQKLNDLKGHDWSLKNLTFLQGFPHQYKTF